VATICDLFVANVDDALRYGLPEPPSERQRKFAPVELRGLSEIEFEGLLAVLRCAQPAHRLKEVVSTDDSFLAEFCGGDVKLLSSLDNESICSAGRLWSEEVGARLDADEAQVLVARVVGLAKTAIQEGKNLYLWRSL
jgi:hypothetical protein